MTNLFLSPLLYKDNIFNIYLFCDGPTRKNLFCLSKTWKECVKNYAEIEKYQNLANRRVRVIQAYFSIQFVFGNTNIPYDFKCWVTIDHIKSSLDNLFVNLKNTNINPDLFFVLSYIPVFPKVVFSSEVKESQLEKIPLELVTHFKRCIDRDSLEEQQECLRKLAIGLAKSANESHLLILADLAHGKGLEGLVIKEYVEWLIVNRKFEQAWSVTEKLPNKALQQDLFTLIVEAQDPQHSGSLASIYQEKEIIEPDNDSSDLDSELYPFCQKLNSEHKYEEALQNTRQITDEDLKMDVLEDIVSGLNSIGNAERAYEIIEEVSNPYSKFSLYSYLYQKAMNEDKFNALKNCAQQIEDERDRKEAFHQLLDIAEEHENESWCNEAASLLRMINGKTEPSNDISRINVDDYMDKMNKIINKANEWVLGIKKDPKEARDIFDQLPEHYKKDFLQYAVKAFFKAGKGELAYNWASILSQNERENLLLLAYQEGLVENLNEEISQSIKEIPDTLLLNKFIIAIMNTIPPNRTDENVQNLIDKALTMDEGTERDVAFEKICETLIIQKNYKDAFEYSDNIENVIKQFYVRLNICRALQFDHKYQLIQQIFDTIQDPNLIQYAYQQLFIEHNRVNTNTSASQFIPPPIESMITSYRFDPTTQLIMAPVASQTTVKRIVDPKNEWRERVRNAANIMDINRRDQIFASLAQEAKQNGWLEELDSIVEKIDDPAIAASCF